MNPILQIIIIIAIVGAFILMRLPTFKPQIIKTIKAFQEIKAEVKKKEPDCFLGGAPSYPKKDSEECKRIEVTTKDKNGKTTFLGDEYEEESDDIKR